MNEPIHDGIGPMTEGGERGEGEHGAALVERLAKVACDTYWKGVGEWCSVGGHKDWCIAIRAVLREVGLMPRPKGWKPIEPGTYLWGSACKEDPAWTPAVVTQAHIDGQALFCDGFQITYAEMCAWGVWAGPIPEPVEESDGRD